MNPILGFRYIVVSKESFDGGRQRLLRAAEVAERIYRPGCPAKNKAAGVRRTEVRRCNNDAACASCIASWADCGHLTAYFAMMVELRGERTADDWTPIWAELGERFTTPIEVGAFFLRAAWLLRWDARYPALHEEHIATADAIRWSRQARAAS